ncbi:hypothetical protein B0I33_107115 [Prauserella shujinwangii]|uniref:Uncharacterized protein n=1 Tax=Prauserella shujinwangii TaxID=1453103 RepID=A0A2T0LSA2_9PSEU|nr:hypothetical protein [Prauserella shujinwangii]PRX46538.1 hypothetical protein B0I33_107115 [Prauserella shujinwangii]
MSPTQPRPSGPPTGTPEDDPADALLRRIGAQLIAVAPEGWRRIDFTATMATMVEDFALTVVLPDGGTPPVDPPPGIKPDLMDLRHRMYEPGRGTWLSLRLVIDPPGSYVVDFNFDLDPRWDPPVPDVVFQRDFEAYPRDPAHVPGWLRERLAGGAGDGERSPRP